jgi:fructose-1,6-bisphosphatase/inositol monophosphatase family enzyme
MNNHKIPSDLLILNAVDAMFESMGAVRRLLNRESGVMLSEIQTLKVDNITREVDQVAELTARNTLYKSFDRTQYRDSLAVWGEESITGRDLDFSSEHRTVALLDMIDGTDLLNRGLENWCSAMVFFYPPERQILATLVGVPSNYVYVASPRDGCFKMKLCDKTHFMSALDQKAMIRLFRNSEASLEDAGICFYGQKARNILSLFGSRFPAHLNVGEFSLEYMLTRFSRSKPPFRVYNLGGNPMMVKVADGTMQIVFELLGQKPHDVVPGAFIARAAGAVVKDLDGHDLRMEDALLRPNEGKMRYIVASSERMYEDLVGYLRTQSGA